MFFLCVAVAAMSASAQDAGPATREVVQFSTAASVSARPDELRIVLRATRDGTDAGRVQRELQGVLDAALAQARPNVQPGALDVQTGSFGLSPRRAPDGHITGWAGSADLTLSGTAMDRIADLAARLAPATPASAGASAGLVVAEVEPRLSEALRERLEREARAQAIARFRAQATDMAQQFGYARYTLREVSVSGSQGGGIRPKLMVAAVQGSSMGAIPVEQGLVEVSVSVSGSVQLLP